MKNFSITGTYTYLYLLTIGQGKLPFYNHQ